MNFLQFPDTNTHMLACTCVKYYYHSKKVVILILIYLHTAFWPLDIGFFALCHVWYLEDYDNLNREETCGLAFRYLFRTKYSLQLGFLIFSLAVQLKSDLALISVAEL